MQIEIQTIGIVYAAVILITVFLYGVTLHFVRKHLRFISIWILTWFGYILALTMLHLSSEIVGRVNTFTWVVLTLFTIVHIVGSWDKETFVG